MLGVYSLILALGTEQSLAAGLAEADECLFPAMAAAVLARTISRLRSAIMFFLSFICRKFNSFLIDFGLNLVRRLKHHR